MKVWVLHETTHPWGQVIGVFNTEKAAEQFMKYNGFYIEKFRWNCHLKEYEVMCAHKRRRKDT